MGFSDLGTGLQDFLRRAEAMQFGAGPRGRDC